MLVEEYVDYVKSYGSATDHYAGSHSPPENVGAGKLPNGQERGNYGNEDAGAGRPERDGPYCVRIEIASSRLPPDFLRIVTHYNHFAIHSGFSEFDLPKAISRDHLKYFL